MAMARVQTFILALVISGCTAARMPAAPNVTTPAPTLAPPTSTRHLDHTVPPTPHMCSDNIDPLNPLGRLRNVMRTPGYKQINTQFDAFLIFYSDEHLSEEPSPEERRLEYISGWDGIGTAAVLANEGAAIWVPSGDLRRARMTMSCAWIVLDADDPSQPTIAEWIAERLTRNGRVGADARHTSIEEWKALLNSFQRENLQLTHIQSLIDQLWLDEMDFSRRRPIFSKIVANLHHSEYTGLSWRDKVNQVRNELRAIGAEAMVVTALDEVAWLLNVRGRDIPYAPLLKAFVIVGIKDVRVYVPPGKLSMPVREALSVYSCYTQNCTTVYDYAAIYADLRTAMESKILIPSAGTFQRGASFAIFQSVPQNKRMVQLSPIVYLKAQKNDAEIKGMRKAHLRDAVAMCTLLSYIEGMAKTGQSEISIAMKVDITRATQASYVGLSMRTKVAFGPNGADPDYRATNTSNRRVFTNSTLIVQSGGQYDEGTTVVTRTLHYGNPGRDIRAAYTSVLRSIASMATMQIPGNLPAAHTDPVVRNPLWISKQDYPHPTGHGVGAALNRKEDPVVIDYRQDTNLHNFREGYFITSEPAWYEKNKFGVKLGNILEVVMKPDGFLGFREATLIPFEPNLIDKRLLTEYEINWLNAYNDRIRKTVGPELKDQGLTDVLYWMQNKTVYIEPPSKWKLAKASSADWVKASLVLVIGMVGYMFV